MVTDWVATRPILGLCMQMEALAGGRWSQRKW